MQDLISVIIPIYNSELYIRDCIRSIQEQTYTNIETIMVDDGSMDNSRIICEEIIKTNQKFRFLFQEHKGVSAARNTGIKAAKGKYLFFLDSDDMIHPELLETLYKLLEQNNAVIATEYYCRKADDLFKLTEQVMSKSGFIENNQMSGYIYMENQRMLWDFLMYGEQGGIGGKMIRRAVLCNIEFDEKLITGEDTKFIYQLIIDGADAVVLNQSWYYYRIHGNNASRKSMVKVYQSIYESIRYISNTEKENGRAINAVRCEEYIIKCLLNWKLLNRKRKDFEIDEYLGRIMHKESKMDIFAEVNWHYKKDFYFMRNCYPLFYLNRKLSDIWEKSKKRWNLHKKKSFEGNDIKKRWKKMEKISVIIPMYNSESYIEQCIRSVINQTYSNLEIIIIDDGSSDRGTEICKQLEISDTRIQLFVQENMGVSSARNRGLDIATGKYVFFLDSDDAIHPILLEELVWQAEEKNAQIALCEYAELYPVWMETVLNRISEKDERPEWKIIKEIESKEWIHKKYFTSLLRIGMLICRNSIGSLRFEQNMSYGNEALFLYHLSNEQLRIAYSTKEWYYHRLYPDNELGLFERIKNESHFDIYRLLRDGENQRGNSSYAVLWERRLVWTIRQEYTLVKKKEYEETCKIIRNQALIERKHPLFKKLAVTAKLLFYCCFFCYPLYSSMRGIIILLDKIAWFIKAAINVMKEGRENVRSEI